MQEERKRASQEGHESKAKSSVFDFLYQDARRVASLLAQFDANGALQSLTQTESITQSVEDSEQTQGGLSIAAAKGSYTSNEKTGESRFGSAARTYDPLWRNARTLLDVLHQHVILTRELEEAHIGQMVLASGSLSVFDVPMFKQILAEPELIRQYLDTQKSNKNAKERADVKFAMKFFSCLPISVQATLESGSQMIWTTLEGDNLQTSATNLFLKYGVKVPGIWHVLGVLDAVPEVAGDDTGELPDNAEVDTLMDTMRKLVNLSRKIGRPRASFGVTPLLIFREIA